MTKTRKPKDDQIVKKIQKQVANLFPEGDALPTHMSIRETEALKARVTELEATLAGQKPASQDALTQPREVVMSAILPKESSKKSEELTSMEKRQKPIAWKWREFSLRNKIILAILLTEVVSIGVLAYFALTRAGQIVTSVSSKFETSVQTQTETQLTDIVRTEAADADQLFSLTKDSLVKLANYRAQLETQNATLGQGAYWDAHTKLSLLPEGQYGNSSTDVASVFLPKTMTVDDRALAELNTSAFLDFSAPGILETQPQIVAVYYMSALGSTTYYPNVGLAAIVPPDFDILSQPFYTIANPQNNPKRIPRWTEPYQDPAGTGLIVTSSAPVYSTDGVFKGVIGIDMQLARISENISQIKIGKTGFAFLVDETGHILAMPPEGYSLFGLQPEEVPVNETPKETILGKGSEDLQTVMNRLVSGESGLSKVVINGADTYIVYTPLNTPGYSLAVIVPVSELNTAIVTSRQEVQNETASSLRTASIILIGLLVGAIILSVGLSQAISGPLTRLTQTAEQISAGDLSARAVITSQDETGTLARAFNFMADRLNEMLSGLEQRVADRTHSLKLAAEVGRTVSQVRALDILLKDAAETIRSRYDLYYVQVYLMDTSQKNLLLKAGTGTVGAELAARGHRLPLNIASINGRAAAEKRPIVVADTASSATFRPNPLLPDTRSEMAVPLLIGEKVVGVLDLQSQQANTLNQEIIPAFEALAGQLAIAIQNSTLLAEAQQARADAEAQARRLTRTGWEGYLDAIQRPERTGYVFNQNKMMPIAEVEAPPATNAQTLTTPIQVTGESIGTFSVELESQYWDTEKKELLNTVAQQVAQQIENLRLLETVDQYRAEAEQAVRRLTREGWDSYLQTSREVATGFQYDLREIKPLTGNLNGGNGAVQKKELKVRNEVIGQLEISDLPDSSTEGADKLIATIAARLSEHIEGLRLAEQTERALIETGQLNRQNELILDSAGEGIFGLDTDGNHTFVNPAAAQLLGYTEQELIGKHSHSTWHHTKPDGTPYPSDECPIYRSIHSNKTEQGDEVFIQKDGTKISVVFTSTPMLEGDRVVGAVVSFRDVTQSKRDQAIIAQRAVQLETVATLSSTTSTLLNPDKLLQTVVDLTKERFGLYHAHVYLAEEAWNTLLLAAGAGEIGRQMVAEGWNIPMDHALSIVARAARNRHSVIANDMFRDKHTGYLSNYLLPDTRSEMAVPMIVGEKLLGVFDVQANTADYFSEEDANIFTTLAAQVAVALQNARLYMEQAATVTQLRELDRLKSSFLANMSHELRTPLNSILGFADVMIEGLDGPLTDNMDNDLKLIQKNGQHLLHLINDVLDMAKIESGRMNLHPETFCLHDLLEEVTSITSSLVSEKDLALFIEPKSDSELEIYADRTRLRQVMLNLVNNAMKFTEHGQISICIERQQDLARITVHDTGIGIPADDLENIFLEFTQVDTSTTRKAGGTGLGLPISRRLIEMHGGRLWVESTGVNGEGSTFYVELPIEAKITEPIEKTEK